MNPPKPTDWHRKPKGFDGPCPICACPVKSREHRAVAPEENRTAQWIKRRKCSSGWRYTSIFAEPKGCRGQKFGATKRTRNYIAQAARIIVLGATYKQAAIELGTTDRNLRDIRQHHPSLWKAARKEAELDLVQLVQQVRSEAGTDRVLENPDAYLARATAADKWITQKGESLFPTTGKLTLCSLFETHYLRLRLADATEGSIDRYRITLRRWRLITGDSPLAEITRDLLATFRDVLAASAGVVTYRRMSPTTIQGHLSNIQTLLEFAGPPGPRRRDCLGLIDRPPWIKPPQRQLRIPSIVSVDHLNAVYLSAPCMDTPHDLPFKAAAWWRGVLVLAYFTGLRAGTLFALRMEWIDWAKRRITIPPQAMKARRPHLAYLHPVALEHLRTIRSDRELVFPLPWVRRQFWIHLRKLERFAAIPPRDYFGLQALRRTAGTKVAEKSGPEVAVLFLGHAPQGVTMRHYVRPDGLLEQAAMGIPVPAAFRNGNGSNGEID